MATDKLINSTQGDDIIDALSAIADNLENVPSSYEFSSAQVVSMAGYQKASTAASIGQGDSLNEAVGKLEKKADDAATAVASMVTGPGSSTTGNLAIFNDGTGKVLADSGIFIEKEELTEANDRIPTCMVVENAIMSIASDLSDVISTKLDATAILPIQSDIAALEGLRMGTLKTKARDIISEEFVPKTWSGLAVDARYIWSDGTNVYYSDGATQKVLNKSTSTWSNKSWSGLTSVDGRYIWSDGTNVYYSNGATQYVLDKDTSTWRTKSWSGLTSFYGNDIWSDGINIYYSYESNQYVLDKSTSTWSTKTWSVLTSFWGSDLWTDGESIYNSYDSTQYVLDRNTSTWDAKTWSGLTSFIASKVWTDGTDIYYSDNTVQYVLDKTTSTWSAKTWSGLTSFDGQYIWTDGTDIYYSNPSDQYVLKRNTPNTHEVMGYMNDKIGDIDAVLEAIL